MDFKITELSEEYYGGKAYVHYAAWVQTYRGLMPDEYLEKRSYEDCLRHTEENPQNTYIAIVNGRVAGFVWYSPEAREYAKRPGYLEINALYVLKDYQGQGIGKGLINRVLDDSPRKSAVLFVLDGNERAIGFYEHMGFRLTGKMIRSAASFGEVTELEMIREGTG